MARKKNKNTFTALSKKVAKQYEGKKVAPEYQGEYGKKYDKEEAKEVGDKVAATVLIHDKMEGGGITTHAQWKSFILETVGKNNYLRLNQQSWKLTDTQLSELLHEMNDMNPLEAAKYAIELDKSKYEKITNMENGGAVKSCGCYKPIRPTLQYKYGGAIDSPKIFVESLSDYNDGRSVGKWLDLSNYTDGETVMEAIQEFLDEVRDEHGGEKREEFAIHDYENFPSMYYHESMGAKDFDRVYEFVEMSKNIPADAIEGYVNYGHDLSEIEDAYVSEYKDAEDFAYQLVDDMGGIDGVENKHFYLFVSDLDRRLVAQEEADHMVSDFKYEDDGERLIEEAGMDVEKYREASENEREEMLDKADETVRERIEEEWEEGLKDPYGFLVEEQGIYSGDDILKSNFVQFDYEKFGEDLLINDYFGVEKGHSTLYVFRRM